METFKCSLTVDRVLGIYGSFSEDGVQLTILDGNGLGSGRGVYIDNKDIPKIIGGLLSKSGVRSANHGDFRSGSHAHLEFILSEVECYIGAVEKAEKIAEKKKLEAEALALLNAVRDFHNKPRKTWEDTHEDVREEFLVLAKAARNTVIEGSK